jgi:exonuclease III
MSNRLFPSWLLFWILSIFYLIPHMLPNSTSSSLLGTPSIPINSFVTCNINSLSLHDPGGLAGRKLSAINTVASLARGHDVVCIQDVRAGSDDFASELRSSLPRYDITFNSNSTTSGGVLTIIAPAYSDFTVVHKVIIANSILQTTITDPRNSNNHITFINSYLSTTDLASAWSDQVTILLNSTIPPNSVFLGDLNHAPLGEDRSSEYIGTIVESIFSVTLSGY